MLAMNSMEGVSVDGLVPAIFQLSLVVQGTANARIGDSRGGIDIHISGLQIVCVMNNTKTFLFNHLLISIVSWLHFLPNV